VIDHRADVLVATDFFTTEVWTLGGLVMYYGSSVHLFRKRHKISVNLLRIS